jgi:putative aldouronate transport system permease protein
MIKSKIWNRIKLYRFIYVMLLPIVVYFVVFNYYPLALGIYSSFRNVRMIGGSEFVGLKNYIEIFSNRLYLQAFVNTLVVGVFTFLLQFVWGLLIALLLNEIRNKIVKSSIQSVTYLPYLLSWSVVGGIWISVFSPSGLVNGFLEILKGADFQPVVFMSEPAFARTIMVFTGAWKGAGYFAVLFLAAVVAIDPAIYEAASIDGASRFRQIVGITLPNIVPTIKVVVMLSVMGLLRNFDQIFVMSNSSIDDKVRNLLYLIYNEGIIRFKIGPATAAATMVLIATIVISYFVRRLIRYDETYE